MVKQQKKNNRKKRSSKGFTANSAKARKINASTEYETCDEQLSPSQSVSLCLSDQSLNYIGIIFKHNNF